MIRIPYDVLQALWEDKPELLWSVVRMLSQRIRATDEALARAVGWDASLVLAAPCCHHDVAAQLRRRPTPSP